MVAQSIQDTIKITVHSLLPNARVLLFGSMARGDANADSDYDVLVIIPQTITPKDKIAWRSKIDVALVDALNAPVDVLLNSEEEIERKIALTNNVIKSAIEEGFEL